MPNRIVKESITTSGSLATLSAEAERLFHRLVVVADDHGRFDGRLPIVRARCFPLFREVEDPDVERWLAELEATDTICRYEVDGKPYLVFVTWGQHQRAPRSDSKFPQPPTSAGNGGRSRTTDSNGAQPLSTDPLDVVVVVKREARSEKREAVQAPAPQATRPTPYSPDFEAFWKPYPLKEGKGAAFRAYKKARQRASQEDLLAGVDRYVELLRSKPDRPPAHAATWLNGDRWLDEASPALAPVPPADDLAWGRG